MYHMYNPNDIIQLMILGGWTRKETLAKKYVSFVVRPVSYYAYCYNWLSTNPQMNDDNDDAPLVQEL